MEFLLRNMIVVLIKCICSDLFQRRSHSQEALPVPDSQTAQKRPVLLPERPRQPHEERPWQETFCLAGIHEHTDIWRCFNKILCLKEELNGLNINALMLLFIWNSLKNLINDMNVHDYRQCSRLLYMRRKSPDAPAFSAQCARSLMEQPESMLARRSLACAVPLLMWKK